MALKKNYEHRLLSSFLLWFIVLLITSYVVLFFLIRFLVLKPNAEQFADLLISLNEAVVEIANNDSKYDLDKLRETYAKRRSQVQIMQEMPGETYKDVWYPGLKVLQNFIESESNGELELKVIDTPDTKLRMIDSRHPNQNLLIIPSAPPFIKIFLIVSLFVIMLTVVVAAWLISRQLTKPLRTLADQAHRLHSEKNSFAILFNEKNALPEIRSLARSLNKMRSELDRTIQDRENLLTTVTHDLRTPLSRLQIALDILSATNPNATPPLLEDIGEMRLILDQFVELGKLNEEIDEPWVEGDLNLFVGRIRDQYRRAGVNLRTQLPEQAVVVKYKAIGLTRLLYNLVDNACRHGDGNVQITVIQAQDDPVLTVSNKMQSNDQGTGLTQALAEQAGRLPTTGLGLRIVRQFAEVHRAQLEESVVDGIKSFSLRFNG